MKPMYMFTDVEEAARAVKENGVGVLCVLPLMISHAAEMLKGSKARVCSAIDLPLGAIIYQA